MASGSLQDQQNRITFYEDGVREIRRLTVEIEGTRNALTKIEGKLDRLSSHEVELNQDKSILIKEISLYKAQLSEREKGLSKTKSKARTKQLTEYIMGENAEIEMIETHLETVNSKLEAVTKEIQPLREEASRLGAEIERLTIMRNGLFDSLTDPSKQESHVCACT